jgi:hypothetical protein
MVDASSPFMKSRVDDLGRSELVIWERRLVTDFMLDDAFS